MQDPTSLSPVQMKIMLKHMENHLNKFDPQNKERRAAIKAAKDAVNFQLRKQAKK